MILRKHSVLSPVNPISMKPIINPIVLKVGVVLMLTMLRISSYGQGRVVINEFMSWSGCVTTSEYIELLNFGPGPMDISCYIVTNGKYSATIPPNTIIGVGEYYILSGQNSIAKNCGNTDSTVQVDLNWLTCNCTNTTIPSTGDGFLQNGGNANEKIILMSPSLVVLDAVSRSSTPSSSNPITTSALNGNCSSKTFDLDTMGISYEAINNSTGIDNSYSRKVDGDCGWVKTTAISANATNKTGSTSSATYHFSTLSASECNFSTGSISIAVSAENVQSLFPMTYTLAYDSDGNYAFDNTDLYTYGTDASAPSIDISNLSYGRYRITIGSSSGCNLQSFDFFIFNCYGIILPYQLKEFVYTGRSKEEDHFSITLKGTESFEACILEGGDGNRFRALTNKIGADQFSNNLLTLSVPAGRYNYFRLKMIDKGGNISYSEKIHISSSSNSKAELWPNPATTFVNLQYHSDRKKTLEYRIIHSGGKIVRKSSLEVLQGANLIPVSVSNLQTGFHYIEITDSKGPPTILKFVKL